MTSTALTRRRKKFIAEYAACDNATEAARRTGYIQRSAKQIGSRLAKVSLLRSFPTSNFRSGRDLPAN